MCFRLALDLKPREYVQHNPLAQFDPVSLNWGFFSKPKNSLSDLATSGSVVARVEASPKRILRDDPSFTTAPETIWANAFGSVAGVCLAAIGVSLVLFALSAYLSAKLYEKKPL